MRLSAVIAVLLVVSACQREKSKDKDKDTPAVATTTGSGGSGSAVSTPTGTLDSKDILARTKTADEVEVKHVLIGWKDLGSVYGDRFDERAKKRTNADAQKLARDLLAQLQKTPGAIDTLVKQHSEDPSSQSGEPYTITKDAAFFPELKNLALRLELNEVGIVQTRYGYHVMVRTPPAPLDPLASADILARPAGTEGVHVLHVLIGWKDLQHAADPRAKARTKADADKLAKEVLEKVRANQDMPKLMKEHSEDPGSKDNARAYPVERNAPMVEPFKKLSLRLKLGEAGMVVTPFGWHVIKRVAAPPPPAPPPPDKLDSTDILKREPTTTSAEVKHILLGWTEVHASDPRGEKRTRAELEKLVKATVAKLKKGDKIEPLMAELSEDPGSAKDGTGYPVTPDAGLVPPFKDLSLRLKLNEVGVVKSQFGIHIIQRVK